MSRNWLVRGLFHARVTVYHSGMKEQEAKTVKTVVEQENMDRLIRMIFDYDDRREYVD